MNKSNHKERYLNIISISCKISWQSHILKWFGKNFSSSKHNHQICLRIKYVVCPKFLHAPCSKMRHSKKGRKKWKWTWHVTSFRSVKTHFFVIETGNLRLLLLNNGSFLKHFMHWKGQLLDAWGREILKVVFFSVTKGISLAKMTMKEKVSTSILCSIFQLGILS